MSAVDVRGPKGPARFGGADLLTWARKQLEIASQIIDNPGGGLLFATQTIGQVRATLAEEAGDRWQAEVGLLGEAEDAAVRRDYDRARERVRQALEGLARA
jgi:hypothetical protein